MDDGTVREEIDMFDKFGEFDSAEEMNRVAAVKLKEGDTDAILKIAEENGIDEDEANDYIDGYASEFVTPSIAAHGKLKVESKDLEIKGILVDWRDTILIMCLDDAQMCAAVRRKGKSLKECMAKIIAFSFENKQQVSDKIVKATTITHNGKKEPLRGPLYLGFPNRSELKELIEKYYLG